ncbi:MAG: endopeptidase La [Firmicutes bacterium]|nr:endopeptidase La [Bacillota bacterium]
MAEEIVIKEVQNIIAVKDVVLFPHLIVPLLISREKSLAALEDSLKKDKIVIFAAQKDSSIENPGTEDLFHTGTACLILQMLKLPDNTHRIVVQGLSRVKIKSFIQTDPFLQGMIEELKDFNSNPEEAEALMHVVSNQFKQSIELGKFIPPDVFVAAINIKEPAHLADVISVHLDVPIEDRQQVLESLDAVERLRKVNELQNKELEILKLESQIQSKARKEIDKTQREYYLRQQLKAIQDELGTLDEEKEETRILQEQIEKAGMPQEVKEVAYKELQKLERIPIASAERTVVRTYIDWLLDVPWSKSTEDRLDIVKAASILDEDHYGLKDVKERILEFLAVRKLAGTLKGPILCFVGPPGVGKTSLGKSIARAMGRKFIRISLGGIRDEAEIRGHRRTYVGALPGRIIQAISQAGSINPLFMMDEIDKVGVDFRGDPTAALLEALDPEQNNAFKDHYLEVPVDLSQVFFILTGNIMDTVPPALRDRMEVISIPGYTEEEKINIATKFLIPKQREAHGLKDFKPQITSGGLRKIIREYTREAGVRNMERNIANICRKIARELTENKKPNPKVEEDRIEKYLGIPRFSYGTPEGESAVGAVKGLSWTEFGGEVLVVEATIYKGKGIVQITGHLGEVMRESAQAALSYVRSRCDVLGVDCDFHRNDIHIHVPEGAIPKDGPSAGITMGTAILSALTGKPVPGNLAMTGEITLRGKILPIGGVKEKVLAASRYGIKTIIMPKENKRNLEEIPDKIKKDMNFVFVDHMDEVISYVFKGLKSKISHDGELKKKQKKVKTHAKKVKVR